LNADVICASDLQASLNTNAVQSASREARNRIWSVGKCIKLVCGCSLASYRKLKADFYFNIGGYHSLIAEDLDLLFRIMI